MLQPTSNNFIANAAAALKNEPLQEALAVVRKHGIQTRANAVAALPEFEALRDQVGRHLRPHGSATQDDRFLDVALH